MELGLQGRVAIVTGGARAIGAAIVEGFVNEGANVVIGDIDITTAAKLASSLKQSSANTLAIETDIRKKIDAENLAARAISEFGRIDILVNNAGVAEPIKFVDLNEEHWNRELDINTKGLYLMTRAVVPHMINARYGKIINASSICGKQGVPEMCSYNASKFAVIGITQALAKELAEFNINVNAYCPGYVRTPMWEGLLDYWTRTKGLPREQIWEDWIGTIPLKRPQTPEDIANVVLFLSSDVSKNITGEAININGGVRMD